MEIRRSTRSSGFHEAVTRPLAEYVHDLEERQSRFYGDLETSFSFGVLLPDPFLLDVLFVLRGVFHDDLRGLDVPVPFNGFAFGTSHGFLVRAGHPFVVAHGALVGLRGFVPGIRAAFGAFQRFLGTGLPFEPASLALLHQVSGGVVKGIRYAEIGPALGAGAIDVVGSVVLASSFHRNHYPFFVSGHPLNK